MGCIVAETPNKCDGNFFLLNTVKLGNIGRCLARAKLSKTQENPVKPSEIRYKPIENLAKTDGPSNTNGNPVKPNQTY